MTRTRYRILPNDTSPYFVTATTVHWLPLFCNPDIASIIFDSLKFLQESHRLLVYAYVLMESHLHLVCEAENLSKELANFKSFTAHKMVEYYKENNFHKILEMLVVDRTTVTSNREHQVWQAGFGAKRIKNKEMMVQKVTYIHFNPVSCGYVDEPEHWRYSSARNFAEMEGMLEVCKDW